MTWHCSSFCLNFWSSNERQILSLLWRRNKWMRWQADTRNVLGKCFVSRSSMAHGGSIISLNVMAAGILPLLVPVSCLQVIQASASWGRSSNTGHQSCDLNQINLYLWACSSLYFMLSDNSLWSSRSHWLQVVFLGKARSLMAFWHWWMSFGIIPDRYVRPFPSSWLVRSFCISSK